jgi:hypothetical protein
MPLWLPPPEDGKVVLWRRITVKDAWEKEIQLLLNEEPSKLH